MSEMIGWIAAEAEKSRAVEIPGSVRRGRVVRGIGNLPTHSFPGKDGFSTGDTERHGKNQNRGIENQDSSPEWDIPRSDLSWEEERERRVYRARTVKILRRYMRYSIETGRLPSLLGREFFRVEVTPYTMVTFEDRVIFVHDMENCLNKLDEFSRELIARHILQEHDQEATARLLGCGKRTICRYVPMVLDLLTEILLDAGLLERSFPIREKPCQGGKSDELSVSDSEESKNIF